MRATEAVRRFSDLLNRVRYRGETFTIERGGEPVCRIEPIHRARLSLRELAELWDTLPQPDEEWGEEVRRASRRQPAMRRNSWA
jgi:antitoxin (DNA-binding transcriptional repressor) of toxin-antitoxin stability system